MSHTPMDLIGDLCRGEPSRMLPWLEDQAQTRQWMLFCCVTIAICGGFYGFTMGIWRGLEHGWQSPEMMMAPYVAIKLPLLIFLTVGINGIINGMLAQVLGSGLHFKQTLLAILMSFTTFSAILASVSPLMLFMVANAPPFSSPDANQWHSIFLLTHTVIIAYAGIVANLRMAQLLRAFTGNLHIARYTLFAWLAGNLFVGAQFSWILRPFYGRPGLEVQFLRDHPFQGTFYENVWTHITQL